MTTTAEWRKWNALNTKPITNADRIRSMTDEELGEWLDTEFSKCEWCRPEKIDGDCERDCKLCVIDWLRQEGE